MGANLISNKRPTAARRSFCLRVAAHFAVHECAYGQNTTAFDRLCCKSRPVSSRPSAIGNNRIRKGGFVNQYSPFGLVLERLFLTPGPKIFLQQYRPKADSCAATNLVLTRSPRRRPCGSGVRGRSAASHAWRPVLADR